MIFDKPKTQAMRNFIEKEGPNGTGRLIGLSIEHDGVWLYTESHKWCDDHGAGSFRGDSETGAIAAFKSRINEGDGNLEYPQPAWRSRQI